LRWLDGDAWAGAGDARGCFRHGRRDRDSDLRRRLRGSASRREAPAGAATSTTERVVPSQLLRIERIVERSRESGLTAHTQLRPVLSEIAAARLARHGVQLNRDHDEARRLLGPEAWELVRPHRRQPPDGRAPGLAPCELEAVLDSLEAL
jgi:hypothetical protein